MAHNIMRVDSTNDRYVTETMIDLNLDLNEDIDFDFFDNAETPSKEPLIKNCDSVNILLSQPCSPQDLEDDDDVQISPHLLGFNLRAKNVPLGSETAKDINSSSDSNEEPVATGKRNYENSIKRFDEYDSSYSNKNTTTETCNSIPIERVTTESSLIKISLGPSISLDEKLFYREVLNQKASDNQDNDELLNSRGGDFLPRKMGADEKDVLSRKSSLSQASVISSKIPDEDELSLNQEENASIKSSENHNEHASSKSSKHLKSEGSGSGYDSDECCPFDSSDNEELLLGVHTLTIIPRESDDSFPHRTMDCGETDNSKEPEMIHTTSCEKAAITARSSSGYSSASCKAHGCMVSRGHTSKGDSRQSSQMKVGTPDIDEFIKSFRKVQPSPSVSFATSEKYSVSKKRKRRNMSFSNEELQRIERENAILLNKIVLQQRTRPSVVHKYDRRVTSNAINRARQLKKIESDNEILLRKIQDVKRKSTLSTQSSRCISQASTSQF